MASPNATFTEIVTTTLRRHPAEIADNVSNHNALYSRLVKKGKIKTIADGGYEIVANLDYAENSTFQRYSGFDTLNIQASDVLSAAKFDWVQAAVNVVASGRELRMNSGKERITSLAKARLKNAIRTAANNMSVDIYSSGALSNQMGGLAHIIQTDGLGTVGGIAAATFGFWANQFKELTGTGAWTAALITGYMHELWLRLVRGTDKPDLLVSTHDFYTAYWTSRNDLQRYKDNDLPDTFDSIKFQSADVIHDNNSNFTATGERMYFLNTDYLEMVCHKDADWKVLDERMSVNQDAVVIPLIFQGQMTTSNRDLQGIMIDAA